MSIILPSGSLTLTRAEGFSLSMSAVIFSIVLKMVLQNGPVPGIPELSLVIDL